MKPKTGATDCIRDLALSESVRIPSSGGVELEAHLAQPPGRQKAPAVLFLHGFPSGAIDAAHIGLDMVGFANRLSTEMGWIALAIRFRGCGTSTGDFSLNGWVEDVQAGLMYMRSLERVDRIWVCGTGTGGSVGLIGAVTDDAVAGVAMLGSPADFNDWAQQPDRLLRHAKDVGAIKSEDFPTDLLGWKAELRAARPTVAAQAFEPRPLLVLHGVVDEVVPQLDARAIADAHSSTDLRLVGGAGHQLRHDPRAVAILLGWLERCRRS